jgi:hypothetical protein
MALNSSGQISLNSGTAGESVSLELGLGGAGTTLNMLDASVRTLTGKATGAIVMPTDFYGKTAMAQYPFSNYSMTIGGVGGSGGGPNGVPGKVKATMGASSGSSASVTYGLMLRAYWSDSNAGAQTYGASRDVAFVSPSTNWTITDLTNMGITYTDVRTTSATRTISVSMNLDDDMNGGYYVITRSGAATFSQWSSGVWTAQVNIHHTPGGRGSISGSWTIPAPTANQLIVLGYTNNTGFDTFAGSLT